MSLLDIYLNIKNKVKLNDAIMDGVAKAISQKDASDFQEIINSSSLNSASPIDHEEKDNIDYIFNSTEPLRLGTKRDFDTVMSTIKSLKKLENDDSFIQTKSLVESFFTKNLDEDSVKERWVNSKYHLIWMLSNQFYSGDCTLLYTVFLKNQLQKMM